MSGGLPHGERDAPPKYVFRPPRHVPLFMALAHRVVPHYLRRQLGIERVQLEPGSMERFKALRGQRVVLTPNHPSYEPPVLFKLSGELQQDLLWLTAREVFEIPGQGWLIERIGCYSIDRGTRDESALNTTRQLIAEGRNWLVLFPEGQEHYLHDFVLPFLPGAARLGLGAIDDMVKAVGRAAGPAAKGGRTGPSAPPPPVYLLPVALRYYYLKDMREEIEALLARLEQRLGLPPGGGAGRWHARMTAIADRVLNANEHFYGIMPMPGDSFQQRLDRLRETILQRCAEGLNAPVPSATDAAGGAVPLRNRIRKLFTAANQIIHAEDAPEGAYAQELDERRRDRARKLRGELRRVLEFVAMTGDYSAAVQTQERFMDVLGRLEMEVFGKLRFIGPRAVAIAAGEPLNLASYYPQYNIDPAAAAEAAMAQQEQTVRSLLEGMAHYCTVLPPELAGPIPEQSEPS
jgi:1-acyl-sn-glycerol-3-phosphate acyltransferase